MTALLMTLALAADYRVVDVVPDFVAFHEEKIDWATLEKRHAAFFRDAIYRGRKDPDRAAFIKRFRKEFAPELPTIVKRTAVAKRKIKEVLAACDRHLPGFKPKTDFYLTISFSFRGKVLDVGGKRVLALGMEYDEGDLAITIAHELFHLYHFETFSHRGGLYRLLWTEGLATYASAVLVPGLKRSAYLGFDAKKMNRCEELLPLLAADLRTSMGENDQRRKRLYFGAEKNDTKVPPESGYYVGLLLVEPLARKMPLSKLARLKPSEVYRLVEDGLRMLED